MLIVAVHALACVAARVLGFDHVSDDDFARVAIAEAFAHTPRLDPSGTSWLPFPFWILGGAMKIAGRSLLVAQGASIVFASLAAATPYLALRLVGVARVRALAGCVFALTTPWALWLGAATVPESFTASLGASAVLALGATKRSQQVTVTNEDDEKPSSTSARRFVFVFAGAMAAACLSRYEAWPLAATIAIALAVRAARATPGTNNLATEGDRDRRWRLIVIAVVVAGPLAWMAWNAHAHDGPLHFFRRVASFKRAIGEGATDTAHALALYPRLVLTTRPEVGVPALLLVPMLRDRAVRERWLVPLLAVAAQIAFLAYGNARDGAPTHHPERALLGPLLVLALFVVDAGATKAQALIARGRLQLVRVAVAAVLAVWTTWIVRAAEIPGRGPADDRTTQRVRGTKLRADGAAEIMVTPCAFEHFALIAAYGAPERVIVQPSTGEPVGPACPRVEAR